jgi:hypothetical protein
MLPGFPTDGRFASLRAPRPSRLPAQRGPAAHVSAAVADWRAPPVIAHLASPAEPNSGPTRRPCCAVALVGPLARRISLGLFKVAAPRCAAPFRPQTLAPQPLRAATNPSAAAAAASLRRRLAFVEEVVRSFAAR